MRCCRQNPACNEIDRSAKLAQAGAQRVSAAPGEQALGLGVRMLPYWRSGGQQRSAARRKQQSPAALVSFVHGDFHKAAAFKRFEIGGERGAIHGEESRNVAEARRLSAIERHQQRKLALRQIERPQRIVKAPGQRARGPLYVETKAAVTDLARECEGHVPARSDGV
jgi:hypothetical protein